MRIGLALPHYDYSFPDGGPLTWAAMVDAAQRAEGLGYDSLWISDHFFLDASRYGAPPGPHGTLEPFTALAGLAQVTERARLGTLVACASFRHPALVAKMATVIDLASHGRFDLGLGAGWYEPEYEAFGYPFGSIGERMSVLEETVEVVGGLFAEGPFSFEGRRVRVAGAYGLPRPIQPGGPPIWVGGKGGPRLLRLVARHAAGWNTVWKWTPAAYGERATELERIAEAEGRDPSSVRRSVGLYALVGEDERDLAARFESLRRWALGGALDAVALEDYAADTLTGTPERCLERLGAFAGHGVQELIVGAASLPFAVFDWSMVELIAESVIPRAREL